MPHLVLETLVDAVLELEQNIESMEHWLFEQEWLISAAIDDAEAMADAEEKQELKKKIARVILAQVTVEKEMIEVKQELAEKEGLLVQLGEYTDNGVYYNNWTLPTDFVSSEEFESHVKGIIRDMYGELDDWIEIDWKGTANNIRVGYTPIKIDGIEYWYR